MADTMPVNFAIPSESAVASYGWTDLASGTGYVRYYGGNTTATTFILSENAFTSTKVFESLFVALDNTPTKRIDNDYDILLNLPRTLKGKAFVTVPIMIRTAGSSAKTWNMYIIAKIRKWDGATETEIANGTSTTFTVAASSAANYPAIISVDIDVTETVFKAGETLRLTIETWGWADQDATYCYGHDPKQRAYGGFDSSTLTFGTTSTTLEAFMPFKVEL